MPAKTAGGAARTWAVTFDTQTCSICEMCVNKCPQHALIIRREGRWEEILFDHTLCDGCGGQQICRLHCPEHAVTVRRVPLAGAPAQPPVLVRGELTVCESCGSMFMPERKLQTLLDQHKIVPNQAQHHCPACRREHLLDGYLESVLGQ